MDDPELAAIRAARMNQLQQQGQAPNGGSDEAAAQAAQSAAAEEEMRRNLLATVLDSAARERRTLPRRSDRVYSLFRFCLCFSGSNRARKPGSRPADRGHFASYGTNRAVAWSRD